MVIKALLCTKETIHGMCRRELNTLRQWEDLSDLVEKEARRAK